jgi:hypothetical protein
VDSDDQQHNQDMPGPAGHVGPAGLSRRQFVAIGAAAGAGALVAGTGRAGAAAASTDAGAPGPAGHLMTATSLGVNTTSGDSTFLDEEVPGLLSGAHIGRVRYPGGGGADFFDWQTDGPVTWPRYMAVLAVINAAPLITVNYGELSQGPAAAAAWVRSANTFAGYSSKTALWVLGNEEYGAWELDQHPDPHTPESFAANALPYFEAMHAADPDVRVGFPMCVPRQVSGGTGTWVADPDLWNRTIMRQDVGQVDFIDFHWYPVFGIPVLSNAQIFETVQRIPACLGYLRGIIGEYGSRAPVICGESNISQSEIVYNCQPVAALYAAATALKFLSHGAIGYLWWQVHNSDNMNGDFGFLSSGTGSPGPSATTLTAPAAAGARNVSVADTTGFSYGHQFTIGTGTGTGSAQESRKITAIGGATTLAAPAAAGARNVKVTTVVPFATGAPVSIGAGGAQELRTVVSVGTGADSGTLAAPAAAGDRNVKIVGTGMGGQDIPVFMPIGFAVGGRVSIGTGPAAETAVITGAGESSSLGTTTVAPAAAGDRKIHVAEVTDTNTGVACYVGDLITIDSGGSEEARVISAVGTGAAAATTTDGAVAAGAMTVRVANGTGMTPGHPLLLDSGAKLEIAGPIASVSPRAATALAVAAATGDTSIKVDSVTGMSTGDTVQIGVSFFGFFFGVTAVVQSVGTAGAAGTGITLTAPLTQAAASGTAVTDVTSAVMLAAPAAMAHASGVTARDIGTGITLTAPLRTAHNSGVPARDAGTGITLAAPLRKAHADGATVTTPGTGIVLSAPLAGPHDAGTAAASTGITLTPALTSAHPSGTAVNELGLLEPPLDTPLPAYWGYVMASLLTAPGAYLSDLPSPVPTVLAYQSFLPGTSHAVMLINTDDAAPVTVAVHGLQRSGTLASHSYGLEQPSVVKGTTPAAQAEGGVLLRPESMTVLTGTAGSVQPPVTLRAVR